MKNLISFLILPAFLCAGEGAVVSGPAPGAIFDAQSHALRLMIGVPGASYLGPTLAGNVDLASVAPNASAALVVRQGALVLVSGLKSEPVETSVANAISNVDLISWSDGAAIVYSSAAGQAQVIRNGSAAAPVAISGKVTALVVAGETILAGIESEGVYAISAGSRELLAQLGNASAILVAGADLYAADRARNQVWQIASFAQKPAPMIFAGEAEGISAPVGLALSTAGDRLYVANANTVTVLDRLSRTAIAQLPLDAPAATLAPFGDPGILLLSAGSDANTPAYVLSERGPDGPAVYFVPAGREQ